MRFTLKNRIIFLLLLLSYLLFSYYALGGWWNSSVGTVLILFFSYLLWNKAFLKQTGLGLTYVTVIKSITLALFITFCSFLVMRHIAGRLDIMIKFSGWRNYFHDIFYTLNEEIVLGAVLLFYLTDRLKIRPFIASALLAVIFALIHYVFYRWIFLDRGIIGISTLATLFFVGFVRNSLILLTGHIGYSWALHFGWMAVMFGSYHFDMVNEKTLGELDKFNIYLGSLEMLMISFILAGIFAGFWIRIRGRSGITV